MQAIKKILLFFIMLTSMMAIQCIAQTKHFTLNTNQSIAYTDVGHGTPILLIHAFPTDQRLWQPQLQVLPHYFRVITIDLPGFGLSSPVNGNTFTMAAYADVAKQLLNKLHIQKAIVGGESMGGYISLAFLEKYPNSVQGLILSNTQAVAETETAAKNREKTAEEILKQGPRQLIKEFMATALAKNSSPSTYHYLQTIVSSQVSTAMASALRGMAARKDTSSILASTPVPVLIISGDKDTIISPQQSISMHNLAKSSQLVLIKNAGHLSNLDHAMQWNQAVINMFRHSS